MDYLLEYKRAEEAFMLDNYDTCVRLCGRLIERGLKDLYSAQCDWYEKDGLSFNLSESFRENHSGFEKFTVSRSGLGRLCQFYRLSGMWDEVRRRVTSNLHFTDRIPWRDLVRTRNIATHGNASIEREHAVEFLHHLKVFLYECELVEDREQIRPEFIQRTSCHNCNNPLLKTWKFCPTCGTQHIINCKNCGSRMEPNWKICPNCNEQSCADQLTAETERLYKAYCEAIWADHIVNAEERDLLRRKRLELGLTEENAEEIEQSVINPAIVQFIGLIEAVLIDGVIDKNEKEFLMNRAKKMKVPESTALRLMDNLRSEIDKHLKVTR